jgi:hypothetical protein
MAQPDKLSAAAIAAGRDVAPRGGRAGGNFT